MRVKIGRPGYREDSRVAQFIKRIPSNVSPHLTGGKLFNIPLGDHSVTLRLNEQTQSIRFSLRTCDPREARVRHAEATDAVERWFTSLQTDTAYTLTHRQIAALGGEFYTGKAASSPDDTLTNDNPRDKQLADARLMEPDEEAEFLEGLVAFMEKRPDDMPPHADPMPERWSFDIRIDAFLWKYGISKITPESRERLHVVFRKLQVDAMRSSLQLARMDYTPPKLSGTFPAWESGPQQARLPERSKVSLQGILADWWQEAQAAGRAMNTYLQYAGAVKMLGDFLKHDDAARITTQDILNYKDFRLAYVNPRLNRTVSARSFKNGELSPLKTIFTWAVDNRKVSQNPVIGVTVKLGRKVKLRERDFTPEEAKKLLEATSQWTGDTTADWARFWVPWLCAYSGARVGEMLQLRKQDLKATTEGWVIVITPEAGTVKGKELREVPLHEHLVEMGFPQFVERSSEGYLFIDLIEDKTVELLLRNRRQLLRDAARETLHDPNVAPSHGWRHTFKTRGFEVGIEEKVLDAICGHKPTTEGRKYGSVSLKTRADAMKRFPRYALGEDDANHQARP